MYIKPIKQFNKTITPPPDKSITHRGIILGSIAYGTTVIKNYSKAIDCMTSLACVRALGSDVIIDGNTLYITKKHMPQRVMLDCNNSGTTMRLLCGVLLPQVGLSALLVGDKSLTKRPMDRIVMPLKNMGGQIECTEDGHCPININGQNLQGISYTMPVASAQVKSAILIAGLFATGDTNVQEQIPTRDHTERLLKAMGANIKYSYDKNYGAIYTVRKSNLNAINIDVPNDFSSAAFWLVLAAIIPNSSVFIKSVGVNITRIGLLDIMHIAGCDVNIMNIDKLKNIEHIADIKVNYRKNLKSFVVTKEIVPRLIDEVPILAILACFCKGTSVFENIGELKNKESNRLIAIVENINKIGGKARIIGDNFEVDGVFSLKGGDIKTYDDHRIAMAFSVALFASSEGGHIDNSKCVAISYPNFFLGAK